MEVVETARSGTALRTTDSTGNLKLKSFSDYLKNWVKQWFRNMVQTADTSSSGYLLNFFVSLNNLN